jgi:hypothetical protein
MLKLKTEEYLKGKVWKNVRNSVWGNIQYNVRYNVEYNVTNNASGVNYNVYKHLTKHTELI